MTVTVMCELTEMLAALCGDGASPHNGPDNMLLSCSSEMQVRFISDICGAMAACTVMQGLHVCLRFCLVYISAATEDLLKASIYRYPTESSCCTVVGGHSPCGWAPCT